MERILQLFEAVTWICNQRQHPFRERMEKVRELTSLKGGGVVNLKEFCGW